MRTSILAWSTVSGAVLGVFLDAALVGLGTLVATLAPATGFSTRLASNRWLAIVVAVALLAIPLALSVLGYLEGELKSV